MVVYGWHAKNRLQELYSLVKTCKRPTKYNYTQFYHYFFLVSDLPIYSCINRLMRLTQRRHPFRNTDI